MKGDGFRPVGIGFPPAVDGVPWDGFRVMEWIHRSGCGKKIPIIIITGDETPIQDGPRAALSTSRFTMTYLLKVIRSVLGS